MTEPIRIEQTGDFTVERWAEEPSLPTYSVTRSDGAVRFYVNGELIFEVPGEPKA